MSKDERFARLEQRVDTLERELARDERAVTNLFHSRSSHAAPVKMYEKEIMVVELEISRKETQLKALKELQKLGE